MADSGSGVNRLDPAPDADGLAHSTDAAGRFERDLDDAVYYLRHECVPCAERHFERARRHGASEEQIEVARSRGQNPV